MARRKYQQGPLLLRGKRNPKWIGRWREDTIEDGKVKRIQKCEVLGTKTEYPTRKLALRAPEGKLSPINNPSYRARSVAKFKEFAEKWKMTVLPNLKPSTQPPIKSQPRKHLVPQLGGKCFTDFTVDLLQAFTTGCKLNPKTIKNLVATLRMMWNSARDRGHVSHDPFNGLVLPEWDQPEQSAYTPEQVQQIIAAAEPPYDTVFRLVAQTGIRRGQVCALDGGHINLADRIIIVGKSRSGKFIRNTKNRRPRLFSISRALAKELKAFVDGRDPGEPLFLTAEGKRLHPDNFVKRELKPIVEALGLKGGLHAFRHGNATAQDRLNTPIKLRQERLGHAGLRTTLGYTHTVGDDDRKLVEQLDRLYRPKSPRILCANVRKLKEKASSRRKREALKSVA